MGYRQEIVQIDPSSVMVFPTPSRVVIQGATTTVAIDLQTVDSMEFTHENQWGTVGDLTLTLRDGTKQRVVGVHHSVFERVSETWIYLTDNNREDAPS